MSDKEPVVINLDNREVVVTFTIDGNMTDLQLQSLLEDLLGDEVFHVKIEEDQN
jgi:hypothetical protein